jgi:hypothetical protein
MRLVAADTGPLNYLVLTGYIELLPELFARVLAHGGGCGCAICCRVCAASNAATARASAWAGPGWCAGRLAGAARRITYLLENGRLQEDNRSPTMMPCCFGSRRRFAESRIRDARVQQID